MHAFIVNLLFLLPIHLHCAIWKPNQKLKKVFESIVVTLAGPTNCLIKWEIRVGAVVLSPLAKPQGLGLIPSIQQVILNCALELCLCIHVRNKSNITFSRKAFNSVILNNCFGARNLMFQSTQFNFTSGNLVFQITSCAGAPKRHIMFQNFLCWASFLKTLTRQCFVALCVVCKHQ